MTGRVAEWFEIDDDGYPKEESLTRLRDLLSLKDDSAAAVTNGVRFMLYDFPVIVEEIGYGRAWEPDKPVTRHPITGEGGKIIAFATGGWSGQETLIGVMLESTIIQMMHSVWLRGGYYEFEVNGRWLDKIEAEHGG